MQTIPRMQYCCSLLLAAVCARAVAAQPSDIDAALAEGNASQMDNTIGDIPQMLAGEARFQAIEGLKARWLRSLIRQKRYADAADLAQVGILAWPLRLEDVEPLLKLRIEALLAGGKNQEAVAAAKGLFNVSSMASTSEAINLLLRCLREANPQDKSVVQSFRKEQEAGGILTDKPVPRAGMGTVMAGIVIDPKPFDEALARYEDYREGLICQGNILLMSDRPAEARKVFQRVYEDSKPEQLAEATENLARCIKAEDGAIGRANKFVLDLRPTK